MSATIEYEVEWGPREGPCSCTIQVCSEDGPCTACGRIDSYEPCPLQGFGCGWCVDMCDCCTPAQRAQVVAAMAVLGEVPYVPVSYVGPLA